MKIPHTKMARITHVRQSLQDECFVGFYIGDVEAETRWESPPPSIGDLFEINPAGPGKDVQKIAGALPDAWATDGDALRWRKPVTPSGLSRMEILRRRHIIRSAVREYLDNAGYMEIDAPLLVRGATPDPAVESFKVGDYYLTTSTEYPMKRLAVGGMEKIYSLTQNFREGDTSTLRNPEFTMLEWGSVGATLDTIEKEAEGFTLSALHKLGLSESISYAGHKIDMKPPWKRISVSEAIEEITGVAMKDFDAPSCRKACEAAGITLQKEWLDDGDFLFSLLIDHIQPCLGFDRPVFVREWPFYQTTSASARDDGKTADRSQLFISGIEISDGFGGLGDVNLQAALFDRALERRKMMGKKPVDLDQKYLEAMRLGAPYGAGIALGFDRLVMILTDQAHIRNVLAFAWDEL